MSRKSRISFGPGAASLILIVVVLSMSVLGMLALMNARSDSRLSERSAQVVEAAYALHAEAERRLADLDQIALSCAGSAADEDDYLSAVELALPEDMTMDGREISWEETDGLRTLSCSVELLPLWDDARVQFTNYRLTAITEDDLWS